MGEAVILQIIGVKAKTHEHSLKLSDGTHYVKAFLPFAVEFIEQSTSKDYKELDLVRIREFKLKVTKLGRFLILKAPPEKVQISMTSVFKSNAIATLTPFTEPALPHQLLSDDSSEAPSYSEYS